MKKYIYIALTVLIIACSGSDDSDNNTTDSAQLIGTWLGTLTDSDDITVTGDLTLTLNADNTGSVKTSWSGAVDTETIAWFSTATTLTIDATEDMIFTYNFINDNRLSLTDLDGDEVILNRLVD
jgi:hypothetical protein